MLFSFPHFCPLWELVLFLAVTVRLHLRVVRQLAPLLGVSEAEDFIAPVKSMSGDLANQARSSPVSRSIAISSSMA